MDSSAMSEKTERLVAGFSGRAGVRISGINTDFEYAFHADDLFSTASTVKVFCLGTLLKQCEEKRLSLFDRIVLKPEYFEQGDIVPSEIGVLRQLSFGDVLTLKDIAVLMTVFSDNTATNMVIDAVGGVNAIRRHLEKLGITRSGINRRLSDDPAVYAKSDFGDASPEDFVRYLRLIDSGKALNDEFRRLFEEILSHQQYKDLFPRYLPLKENYEDAGRGNVAVANKTGWMPDTRGDVGFLTIENRRFLYAVLTNGCTDLSYWSENEGSLLIARIGRIFYDEVMRETGRE